MAYTIKIETMTSGYAKSVESVVIESIEKESLKEAKKSVKDMMEKHTLIKHAGHIVNYSKNIELHTNF